MEQWPVLHVLCREYLRLCAGTLTYINDLTCEISSTIRLYADDVIIYRQIDTEEDVLKLQEDLAELSRWAQDWLMHFNVSI